MTLFHKVNIGSHAVFMDVNDDHISISSAISNIFFYFSDSEYDTFVGKLLTFKMIVNELGKESADRGEIDDSTTDLDFYVDRVHFLDSC